MRVCFPFVGDTIGGSHLSAALLIRHLAGVDPVVVVHRTDGPLAGEWARRAIAWEAAPVPTAHGPGPLPAQLAALARDLPALVRFLRRREIDIVHVNDARSLVTWALAARLAGAVLVHHQRTRWAPSRLVRAAAGLAAGVIAISDFVAGTLPPGLRARARVIANPFEPDAASVDRVATRQRLAAAAGLPADAPWVLFVGTLQEQKRPRVFCAAAERLAATGPGAGARFLMLGRDGDDAARLRAQVDAAGPAGRISLLGHRPDALDWIGCADLVLAPAVNEGHGRVLVEAALAGVPVIAARSGGHDDIIADGVTGLLVPPDDPDALAAAAAALLADPEGGRRMGEAARAAARSRFVPAAHAAAVADLYAELLEGRA